VADPPLTAAQEVWPSLTDSRPYADQDDHDYQAFTNAIHSGQLQALQGV
jgi:hypothetical protein